MLRMKKIYSELLVARNELVESETRYRDLVEKTQIGILIDDKDGNFTYFNQRFINMFGYTEKEMKQQSIRTLVHHDDVERVLAFHKSRLGGGKSPSRYELRGIRKDGVVIWIEVDVVTLEEDGKAKGTRSYLWDITERKQVEKVVKESEERYRTLAETAQDFIYIVDRQMCLQYVNRTGARLFRTKPEHLIGKSLDDLFPLSHEKMSKNLLKIFESEQSLAIEDEYVFSGQKLWLDVRLAPLTNTKGKVVAIMGVSRDITERKRMEKELKNKMTQMEKLNELFVGRELRMVELKREINMLLERLKEPARYGVQDQIEELKRNLV